LLGGAGNWGLVGVGREEELRERERQIDDTTDMT